MWFWKSHTVWILWFSSDIGNQCMVSKSQKSHPKAQTSGPVVNALKCALQEMEPTHVGRSSHALGLAWADKFFYYVHPLFWRGSQNLCYWYYRAIAMARTLETWRCMSTFAYFSSSILLILKPCSLINLDHLSAIRKILWYLQLK